VPFLAGVEGFVEAAAGRFAGVDDGGNGCAAALVVVAPAAAGGGSWWFAPACHSAHREHLADGPAEDRPRGMVDDLAGCLGAVEGRDLCPRLCKPDAG
jgi:hypothetical protein